MSTFRSRVWIGAVLGGWLVASAAQAGGFLKVSSPASRNHYIVVLDAGVAARPSQRKGRRVKAVATELARLHGVKVLKIWEHALQGFEIEASEKAARHLAKDPWVKLVEEDAALEAVEAAATPLCTNQGTVQYEPSVFSPSPQSIQCSNPGNDCYDNWALSRVDQRFRPFDGTYRYGKIGTGVHMYFVDTGIHPQHQDFKNAAGVTRIGTGRNFASHSHADPLALNPSNYISPTNTFDDDGHGTHIAAVGAGLRYGVAKNATIHPVRVAFEGGTRTAIVVDGLNWIAANAIKPAVVNISLNFWLNCPRYIGDSPADFTAVDSAAQALISYYGIQVFNSAGNFNRDASEFSPTRVTDVFVVGASDRYDERWALATPGVDCHPSTYVCDRSNYFTQCGSNWGYQVDLFAPAAEILSAWNVGIVGDAACMQTGTSMAAPLAAGTAALYLESFPLSTPVQVRDALLTRATVNVMTGALGFGSPNKLLYIDQPPTAAYTFGCTGRTCTFNGSVSSDDFGVASYGWSFGDATPAGSGASVAHTFAVAGTYSVVLSIGDSWGNGSTRTQSVTVP